MEPPSEDTILDHLREVSYAKRAMFSVAVDIHEDYPSQAHTLLSAVKGLTASANKLLGDTAVG